MELLLWLHQNLWLQAKDFDGAIEVAQDFPDYDLGGTVEIREIMVFDQP